MHGSFQQIVGSAARAGALVALAMLLILGVLPAILAAQVHRPYESKSREAPGGA